jgi:hypothetical protein
MKLFSRRRKDAPKPDVKTIICIPGNWNDERELLLAIVQATEGKYMFAGRILMHVGTEESFELELCDYDERMEESFSVAGMTTRISDATLEAVKEHRSVVYITGNGGSYAAAEAIARAAGVLLKAGGLGIKVETTGKAFDAQVWTDLLADFDTPDLYRMFVVDSLAEEDGTVFSCGMHNLGLRDTIVSGEEFQEAVQLIKIFSFYQIVDNPVIRGNETFTATVDAPVFVIVNEPEAPYNDHDLFENPFGMWRLKRR